MREFIEMVEGKMDAMGFKHAEPARKGVFSEFQRVKLKTPLSHDGVVYPAETTGIVIIIHNSGEAYGVELFKPSPAIVDLYPNQIEAA